MYQLAQIRAILLIPKAEENEALDYCEQPSLGPVQ